MLNINLDLNGKTVLITGGTGSFGQKCAEIILNKYPDIKRLVIFSRDELKQYEMAEKLLKKVGDPLRFFIGDVRDRKRLYRAFEDVDFVIHAAAMKQVPASEYNPTECIKTNILGAENVISAAMDCGVKRVIALSTDKAAAPINLYGATKLCSDKLFVAANNNKGKRDLRFSIVRYGNVMGSRGSVIPYFLNKKKEGILPITHPEMTRFNITLEEGVNLVLFALENCIGGEIFVPKLPSYKITELAKAISSECEIKITGIRPGEKLHEDMITKTDGLNTIEFKKYYLILPASLLFDPAVFLKNNEGKKVPEGFEYNSGTNDCWLSAIQLRELIKKHIDSNLNDK